MAGLRYTDERERDDSAREQDDADNLAPVRGVLAGALTAIAIWLAIIAVMLLVSRSAGSTFTQLALARLIHRPEQRDDDVWV